MATGCQFVGNGWGNCTGRVQGTNGWLDFLGSAVKFVSPFVGTAIEILVPKVTAPKASTTVVPGPLQTATEKATETAQKADMTKMLLIAGGIGLAVYLLSRRRR